MTLTDDQVRMINRWVSAVETGTPEGNYGLVKVFADGPKGQPQITYGRQQTTEAGGNLKKLVKLYLDDYDCFLSREEYFALTQFLKAPQYSRHEDQDLLCALRNAGKDPVMQKAQDRFFREHYLHPAFQWADANGFNLPLSALVIFDSFIHSGGIPSFLRRRFRERPPVAGGNEKTWIRDYTVTRHQWLKYWGDGKSRKSRLLRSSRYRTDALLTEIARDNWDLSLRPLVVNGIAV